MLEINSAPTAATSTTSTRAPPRRRACGSSSTPTRTRRQHAGDHALGRRHRAPRVADEAPTSPTRCRGSSSRRCASGRRRWRSAQQARRYRTLGSDPDGKPAAAPSAPARRPNRGGRAAGRCGRARRSPRRASSSAARRALGQVVARPGGRRVARDAERRVGPGRRRRDEHAAVGQRLELARCRSPRGGARSTYTRARRSSARNSSGSIRPAKRTPSPDESARRLDARDDQLLAVAPRRRPRRQHPVEALLLRVGRVGDGRDVARGRQRPRRLDGHGDHQRLAVRRRSARPPSLERPAAAPREAPALQRAAARCRAGRAGSRPQGVEADRPRSRPQQRRGGGRVDDRRAARARSSAAAAARRAPPAPRRGRSARTSAARAPRRCERHGDARARALACARSAPRPPAAARRWSRGTRGGRPPPGSAQRRDRGVDLRRPVGRRELARGSPACARAGSGATGEVGST